MKLLCYFGWHNWHNYQFAYDIVRGCKHCTKLQRFEVFYVSDKGEEIFVWRDV